LLERRTRRRKEKLKYIANTCSFSFFRFYFILFHTSVE